MRAQNCIARKYVLNVGRHIKTPFSPHFFSLLKIKCLSDANLLLTFVYKSLIFPSNFVNLGFLNIIKKTENLAELRGFNLNVPVEDVPVFTWVLNLKV